MTLQPRINVLLAEVGSQHVRAAVERYQAISLLPKSRITFSLPSISGGSYRFPISCARFKRIDPGSEGIEEG